MKKFRIMFSILVSVLTPDHTFWRAGSCIYHFTTALPTAVRGSGGRKQGVRPREWRCALEGKRKAAVNRVRGRIQSSMLECSAQRASWQAEGCDPLGKLLTLACEHCERFWHFHWAGDFCSPCGVAGGLRAAGCWPRLRSILRCWRRESCITMEHSALSFALPFGDGESVQGVIAGKGSPHQGPVNAVIACQTVVGSTVVRLCL